MIAYLYDDLCKNSTLSPTPAASAASAEWIVHDCPDTDRLDLLLAHVGDEPPAPESRMPMLRGLLQRLLEFNKESEEFSVARYDFLASARRLTPVAAVRIAFREHLQQNYQALQSRPDAAHWLSCQLLERFDPVLLYKDIERFWYGSAQFVLFQADIHLLMDAKLHAPWLGWREIRDTAASIRDAFSADGVPAHEVAIPQLHSALLHAHVENLIDLRQPYAPDAYAVALQALHRLQADRRREQYAPLQQALADLKIAPPMRGNIAQRTLREIGADPFVEGAADIRVDSCAGQSKTLLQFYLDDCTDSAKDLLPADHSRHLPDLDQAYRTAFEAWHRKYEKSLAVLLRYAVEELSPDDYQFWRNNPVKLLQATMTATKYIPHVSYTFKGDPSNTKDVRLAGRLSLLFAANHDAERRYFLVSMGDRNAAIVRRIDPAGIDAYIDSHRDAFFDADALAQTLERALSTRADVQTLAAFPAGEPTRRFDQTAATLAAFVRQEIYDFGYERTAHRKTVEQIQDFLLGFIPGYDCVDAIVEGRHEEAVLPCVVDAYAIAMPLMSRLVKAGQAMARLPSGLLSPAAMGELTEVFAVRGAWKATGALARRMQAPLREIGKDFAHGMGKDLLRIGDPGFEITYRLFGKARKFSSVARRILEEPQIARKLIRLLRRNPHTQHTAGLQRQHRRGWPNSAPSTRAERPETALQTRYEGALSTDASGEFFHFALPPGAEVRAKPYLEYEAPYNGLDENVELYEINGVVYARDRAMPSRLVNADLFLSELRRCRPTRGVGDAACVLVTEFAGGAESAEKGYRLEFGRHRKKICQYRAGTQEKYFVEPVLETYPEAVTVTGKKRRIVLMPDDAYEIKVTRAGVPKAESIGDRYNRFKLEAPDTLLPAKGRLVAYPNADGDDMQAVEFTLANGIARCKIRAHYGTYLDVDEHNNNVYRGMVQLDGDYIRIDLPADPAETDIVTLAEAGGAEIKAYQHFQIDSLEERKRRISARMFPMELNRIGSGSLLRLYRHYDLAPYRALLDKIAALRGDDAMRAAKALDAYIENPQNAARISEFAAIKSHFDHLLRDQFHNYESIRTFEQRLTAAINQRAGNLDIHFLDPESPGREKVMNTFAELFPDVAEAIRENGSGRLVFSQLRKTLMGRNIAYAEVYGLDDGAPRLEKTYFSVSGRQQVNEKRISRRIKTIRADDRHIDADREFIRSQNARNGNRVPEEPSRSFPDFDGNGDERWRGDDSEYKILSVLRADLGSAGARASAGRSGKKIIKMVTKIPPCVMCKQALAQFSQDFPEMALEVAYLGRSRYEPVAADAADAVGAAAVADAADAAAGLADAFGRASRSGQSLPAPAAARALVRDRRQTEDALPMRRAMDSRLALPPDTIGRLSSIAHATCGQSRGGASCAAPQAKEATRRKSALLHGLEQFSVEQGEPVPAAAAASAGAIAISLQRLHAILYDGHAMPSGAYLACAVPDSPALRRLLQRLPADERQDRPQARTAIHIDSAHAPERVGELVLAMLAPNRAVSEAAFNDFDFLALARADVPVVHVQKTFAAELMQHRYGGALDANTAAWAAAMALQHLHPALARTDTPGTVMFGGLAYAKLSFAIDLMRALGIDHGAHSYRTLIRLAETAMAGAKFNKEFDKSVRQLQIPAALLFAHARGGIDLRLQRLRRGGIVQEALEQFDRAQTDAWRADWNALAAADASLLQSTPTREEVALATLRRLGLPPDGSHRISRWGRLQPMGDCEREMRYLDALLQDCWRIFKDSIGLQPPEFNVIWQAHNDKIKAQKIAALAAVLEIAPDRSLAFPQATSAAMAAEERAADASDPDNASRSLRERLLAVATRIDTASPAVLEAIDKIRLDSLPFSPCFAADDPIQFDADLAACALELSDEDRQRTRIRPVQSYHIRMRENILTQDIDAKIAREAVLRFIKSLAAASPNPGLTLAHTLPEILRELQRDHRRESPPDYQPDDQRDGTPHIPPADRYRLGAGLQLPTGFRTALAGMLSTDASMNEIGSMLERPHSVSISASSSAAPSAYPAYSAGSTHPFRVFQAAAMRGSNGSQIGLRFTLAGVERVGRVYASEQEKQGIHTFQLDGRYYLMDVFSAYPTLRPLELIQWENEHAPLCRETRGALRSNAGRHKVCPRTHTVEPDGDGMEWQAFDHGAPVPEAFIQLAPLEGRQSQLPRREQTLFRADNDGVYAELDLVIVDQMLFERNRGRSDTPGAAAGPALSQYDPVSQISVSRRRMPAIAPLPAAMTAHLIYAAGNQRPMIEYELRSELHREPHNGPRSGDGGDSRGATTPAGAARASRIRTRVRRDFFSLPSGAGGRASGLVEVAENIYYRFDLPSAPATGSQAVAMTRLEDPAAIRAFTGQETARASVLTRPFAVHVDDRFAPFYISVLQNSEAAGMVLDALDREAANRRYFGDDSAAITRALSQCMLPAGDGGAMPPEEAVRTDLSAAFTNIFRSPEMTARLREHMFDAFSLRRENFHFEDIHIPAWVPPGAGIVDYVDHELWQTLQLFSRIYADFNFSAVFAAHPADRPPPLPFGEPNRRAQLIGDEFNRVFQSRNFAIAVVELRNGRRIIYHAVSGSQAPPPQTAEARANPHKYVAVASGADMLQAALPCLPNLTPIFSRQSRQSDTERMLSARILREHAPDEVSRIRIVSRLPICHSCVMVCVYLARQFPQSELVFAGFPDLPKGARPPGNAAPRRAADATGAIGVIGATMAATTTALPIHARLNDDSHVPHL